MIFVADLNKTFKLYQTPSDRLKEIVFRRRRHREFRALRNVGFEVAAGETLGIIGQNGAGKSTILKILTGILMPDSGTVNLSGKITGLLELGTGFNAEFSGLDNIFLNGTYLGLSRPEIEKRLDTITAFSELGDFIHEPLRTYSSGMAMRLAFSIAIHADPRTFVVDEALAVGDAYFQQKCMEKIRQFKDNGGAIVFVSHDMNAVKVLCDRALLLEKGEILEQGDPEKIVNAYNFLIARHADSENIVRPESREDSGYGNHRVTIDCVGLQDSSGTEIEIAVSGAPAKIPVTFTPHDNVQDLSIGIMIRDKYGQDIFGTNTFYLNKPIPAEKDRPGTVTFNFNEFNLGPGKYTVTAAAHTRDSHIDECFHWIDRSFSFEVVAGSDFYFSGLNRLVPELDYSPGKSG